MKNEDLKEFVKEEDFDRIMGELTAQSEREYEQNKDSLEETVTPVEFTRNWVRSIPELKTLVELVDSQYDGSSLKKRENLLEKVKKEYGDHPPLGSWDEHEKVLELISNKDFVRPHNLGD